MATKHFISKKKPRVQSEALSLGAETVAETAADVHYQMDDYALNRRENTIASNMHTSIITSPANGHLPKVKPAAETRAAEYNAYRREHGYIVH